MRQENVERKSTSTTDQLATADVYLLESCVIWEKVSVKENSVKWDASYNKNPTLTDANYILIVTRQESNMAPEDFPSEEVWEMSGSSLPGTSLNVHGLATTGVESNEEGKWSEEEEELVLRLDK